jgi:prepilin-type N-terminal cleavage/methylation domain-containing protein
MIMATVSCKATSLKHDAFTLVELLVTMVIISIVTGLSLAGLASSRQRAKIDKTKSTIRKLHEIVMPQYESYLSRRVAATTPTARLAAIRLLMVQEMPDQWADVYPSGGLTTPHDATAPTRRYATYKNALSPSPLYEGAECLAMIITRGGFADDAPELFRSDEMGDLDSDGAPEFRDGWGRPIGFFRWAAGFSSFAQIQNASVSPDPLDPFRVSTSITYPPGTTQTDYALVPLIYSSGPGGATDDPLSPRSGYQIDTTLHWLQSAPISSTRLGSPVSGEIGDLSVAADNITNHDLLSK